MLHVHKYVKIMRIYTSPNAAYFYVKNKCFQRDYGSDT